VSAQLKEKQTHQAKKACCGRELKMKPFLKWLAAASIFGLGISVQTALAQQPIRIGVPTSIQLQVGRDTQNAAKLATDEINAKGGVLGRKLEIVVADETENPEQGIAAIKKLTADDKVDVLIGGYTSGVTLAQLPHISRGRRRVARDHREGEGRLR
jgi:branched-chain amino acid transport system substrate-binding protein